MVVSAGTLLLVMRGAGAQSAEPPAEPAPEVEPVSEVAAEPAVPAPAPSLVRSILGRIQIHGFASQGGFVSTSNDYIGESSRGSLKLFEAGINFSTEITDGLRVGMQLFARDFGVFEDVSPKLDWAFVDYRFKPWLGLRAGIIKMPFGLYNEYLDIDAARVPILMPQGVYAARNRDALLAHRGFTVYGTVDLAAAGALEYQALIGGLSIPASALTLSGASLDRVDTKYITGAQLFWLPPVEGLRVGGTALVSKIDYHLTLPAEIVTMLEDAGVVPEGFDGALVVSQNPNTWVIGSFEYVVGDWLFAAEYSRAFQRQETTLPQVLPATEQDSEQFYGMVSYRLFPAFEAGAYYSVLHSDAGDRGGDDPKYAESFHAFQRDLAVTLRYDVNEHWLWKLEGHLIDGTAELPASSMPDRYWGLFLFKTTATF